jgi:hypothetical protein
MLTDAMIRKLATATTAVFAAAQLLCCAPGRFPKIIAAIAKIRGGNIPTHGYRPHPGRTERIRRRVCGPRPVRRRISGLS